MYNRNKNFILKGEIAYSVSLNQIETIHQGYLVCENGKCAGVFEQLPEKFKDFPIYDYQNRLIIPGMTDLHVHAPQYTFRGLGMDLELLEWLNVHTFPEEAKYSDLEYAKHAYSYFTEDLRRCFTTRAVIFATLHTEATIALMEQLEQSGIVSYVGKVNMDRNGGQNLEEESAEASLQSTIEWLQRIQGRFQYTFPILTPRFIPSCTDELMKKIGELSKSKDLRIQSHLSENQSEIAWVKELVPASSSYANAYELFGAIGDKAHPAIMAHCVYSDDEEISIMKKYGTYVAHCPESNLNLTSGIAPIKKFLKAGLQVGLGTDVAGGSSMNMVQTMLSTIQCSKMYYRLVDQSIESLTFEETFYLATMGGGSYFGKVGSFLPEYDFDALIIDDSKMFSTREMSIKERIERMVYNDVDCVIIDKYVQGRQIFEK